jgi:hypothetical protein
VIGLPLVGEIEAAGMTTTRLGAEIAHRATTFVKEVAPASVVVTITAINSYRFTVAGNVEKPGLFSSARDVGWRRRALATGRVLRSEVQGPWISGSVGAWLPEMLQ